MSRSPRLIALLVSVVVAAPACASAFEHDETAALERAFPANASRALDRGAGFEARGSSLASRAARVAVDVEERGVVRVQADGGAFEVRLHELGARGVATSVRRAASYERADGRAYWSADDDGAEEWLASAAPASGPVASWQIEGASPRAVGGAVELVDVGGTAHLVVTAPLAFGAGERELGARLVVRGDMIQVFVDGARAGEPLLVDPKFAPAWVEAGSLFGPRVLHAMAELPDGEVFVVNGYAGNAPVFDCEIYDPSSNEWRGAPQPLQKRAGPTATTLLDGRVLVAGGNDGSGFIDGGNGVILANAEISDPLAGVPPAFVEPMHVGRELHTAALLADGRALVVGGYTGSASLAEFEIYDPQQNTWSQGSTAHGYAEHTETVLGDGRVFVTQFFAEIFDPTTGAFTAAANPPTPRVLHTATLLGDGRVLVVGGTPNGSSDATTAAEIYDPATDHWSTTGSLTSARAFHTATRLADGRVLVAGGFPGLSGSAWATTEIYDPTLGAFAAGPSMQNARAYHTAALLPAGQVLVVAGANLSVSGGVPNTADLESAELYSPYLRDLGEPCGASTACESGFCVEGVCCDTACNDSPCSVCATPSGAATAGHCMKLDPDACKAHPCTGDGECQSHHCADGVCCDKKCDGNCETCAVVRGTCTPAPEGTDPRSDCAMPGEPLICGPTCDGKGKCTNSILNTPCVPAHCADETHAVAVTTCQTIDGGLGCPPPSTETTDCAPFKCDPLSGSCKESCTTVRDCPSGYVCTLDGTCERTPKESAEDDSGCSVGRDSGGTPERGALVLLALVALAAARRRPRFG